MISGFGQGKIPYSRLPIKTWCVLLETSCCIWVTSSSVMNGRQSVSYLCLLLVNTSNKTSNFWFGASVGQDLVYVYSLYIIVYKDSLDSQVTFDQTKALDECHNYVIRV